MSRRKAKAPPLADTHAPAGGRARRPIALTLAAGAVLAAALVWLKPSFTPRRPNVLLVTIDTLRADRVGCYGYAGAATPTLDALAGRGVLFTTGIAQAPLTAPSHASILTGLTPLRHGVRDNGAFVLPSSIPTLAERFRAAGYRTGAFVSGFPLDHRFGLGRGFDLYDDRLPHGNDPRRAPYVERTADITTDRVLAWLQAESTEAKGTAPWFLWAHYFDPHAPYEAPGDFARRFAANPYDGEVAFVDEQVGRIAGWLASSSLVERTLILVTADHGESLGEHGEETHGVFVYDSTLRVPWILAGPGIPHRVSPVVARSIDIAPTLLDYAGLASPPGIEGRSLRPAADGKTLPDAPAYAESLFSQRHLGWAPLYAWRTARLKLVEAPRPELYDLATDAAEIRDLAAARSDVVESMRRPLQQLLATRPPAAAADAPVVDIERLAALGYLGSTSRPPAGASGRDPKEGIDVINRLERGLAEARANPAIAVQALTAVLQQDPNMELAYRYRSIAYQAQGRLAESLKDLRSLERFGPLGAEDLELQAESLRLAGRAAEGLAPLEQAARLEPASPEPPLLRGRLLRTLGRKDEAADAYRRVLDLAPEHAEALRGLGDLSLEAGSVDGAARFYERILAVDANDAEARVRLGICRVRAGQLAEGLGLLQEAVALVPANAEAHLSLGGALAKSGRTAEAIPHFEKAVELGGRTTVALNSLAFARLETGDARGALEALRQSLAIDPRQGPIAEAAGRLARGEHP